VLPKALQELVDDLRGKLPVDPTLDELQKQIPPGIQQQLPPSQGGNQQSEGVLLDYLLAR
ncbi:MAG: hypothetical protein H0V29_12265, partial [Thermoleophilaceae bacterium]|nr:hypothetical protein [Thermoleophilaceae bacterium]